MNGINGKGFVNYINDKDRTFPNLHKLQPTKGRVFCFYFHSNNLLNPAPRPLIFCYVISGINWSFPPF